MFIPVAATREYFSPFPAHSEWSQKIRPAVLRGGILLRRIPSRGSAGRSVPEIGGAMTRLRVEAGYSPVIRSGVLAPPALLMRGSEDGSIRVFKAYGRSQEQF